MKARLSRQFFNCVVAIVCLFVPLCSFGKIVHVTPTGAGNHSGDSWANAATLSEAGYDFWFYVNQSNARPLAGCGDEVWVARGGYTDNLQRPGFEVQGSWYGGFVGNETNRNDRDPYSNPTVIQFVSGSFGNKIKVNSCANGEVMDGFTLQYDDDINPNLSNFTFSNCRFISCTFDLESHPAINFSFNRCTFEDIPTLDCGESVCNFSDCFFSKCGGAGSNGALTGTQIGAWRCTFDSCHATGGGAAIFLRNSSYIHPSLTVQSCLITNNTAGGSGGAIDVDALNLGGVKVTNNTFINNFSTAGSGHALYVRYTSNNTTVASNIARGTNPSTTIFGIANNFFSGGGNFVEDGSANGNQANPMLNPDYTLKPCSPAINAGINAYIDGQTTDRRSYPRVAGAYIDAGCYEYQSANIDHLVLTASTTTMCPDAGGVALQLASSYNGISSYHWYVNNFDTFTTVPRITVYPSLQTPNDYRVEQTAIGCTASSNLVHITVYQPLVGPNGLVSTPPYNSSICYGTTVNTTITPGTGGGPSCVDEFRYSISGGQFWQPYTPGTSISSIGATSGIVIQGRRGGCTACAYTPWQTIAIWPIAPSVNTGVAVTGTSILQPGQPLNLTATTSYGGTSPTFVWTRNGQVVGTNSPNFTDNNPTNGDVIVCTETSNYAGCIYATTATDTVRVTVSSVSITNPNLCINQPITGHFSSTPARVIWQYYNGLSYPDTAYVAWSDTGTSVANCNGQMGNGIFVDRQGDLYVAEMQNHRVMKYSAGNVNGVMVAGNGTFGTGPSQLYYPIDVYVDDTGNVFVLDEGNSRVQKWPPLATQGITVAGGNGAGSANNQLGQNVTGMTINRYGQIYIADASNDRIQVWNQGDPAGVTVADGDGILDVAALDQLYDPFDVAVDDRGAQDTMYITDKGARVIKWTAGAPAGVVVAGGNGSGNAANQLSSTVKSIYRDPFGDLYIVDGSNQRVQLWRRGATTGITVAGRGGGGTGPTQLTDPFGVAISNTGDLYVSQYNATFTTCVKKYAASFPDSTLMAPLPGLYNALVFYFSSASTLTNTLDIVDMVTPSVSIVASDTIICPGSFVSFTPTAINGGTQPRYKWYVNGTLADSTTGDWVTNILQTGDSVYCELTTSEDCVTNTTATSNTIGMKPFIVAIDMIPYPSNATCQGDALSFIPHTQNGGANPAYAWMVNNILYSNDSIFTSANLNDNDTVRCIFTSSSGCTSQPTDTSNSIVVKVSTLSLGTSGICPGSVLTASTPVIPSVLQWLRNDTVVRQVTPDWNPTATELLSNVYGNGVTLDNAGNIYLADAFNARVQQLKPGNTTAPIIAGGNGTGYTGNQMYQPTGVCVDTAGNIYVADYYRVSKWSRYGEYLGNAAGGNGPGTAANQLDGANDVSVDKQGNLYVNDKNNGRIQKFTPGATNGITVAGGNGIGSAANQLSYTGGICVDDSGAVYIADYQNHRVQKWAPGATAGVTVAGGHGQGTAANQVSNPNDVYVDGAGSIFVLQANGRIALWLPGDTAGKTILSLPNAGAFAINKSGDIFITDRNNGKLLQYAISGIADTLTAIDGGTFTARINTSAGCSITTDADTIYPATASISIVSNQGTIVCSGKDVTLVATAQNGGSSPVYQWMKNGVPVGTNSSIYITNNIQQDDTITCTLTANAPCLTNTNVQSNSIIMSIRGAVYSNMNYNLNSGDTLQIAGQTITDSGTYTLNLASVYGCDSIVTLHLVVNSILRDTVSQAICAGQSFSFAGQSFSSTGFYSDTLQDVHGNDSIITLALNVLPTASSSISASICSGGSYSFGGQTLTASGTYADTLASSNGCDSIITLTLTVGNAVQSSFNQSICAGGSYQFAGQTLTTAGTYNDTLVAAAGCDSIVTLVLNVWPSINSNISASICSNDTFQFGGQGLTSSGTYTDTLASSNGCDSIVTLTLTVSDTLHYAYSQNICAGGSFQFGGQMLTTAGTYYDTVITPGGCLGIVTLTLTQNNAASNYSYSQNICPGASYLFDRQVLTVAGTYYDTLQTAGGCDSIVTLVLNVLPRPTGNIMASICSHGSYQFGTRTLTAPGTYTATFTSQSGCDSVVTLTLVANNSVSHSSFNQSICAGNSYQFGNQTLTVAGTYYDTLQTAAGCDSIVTLVLSTLPVANSNISAAICSNDSYQFGGQTLTTAGTYTDTLQAFNGCDSIVTLTLTVNSSASHSFTESICPGDSYNFNGQLLSTAGSYIDTLAAANGCDSVVTLQLQVAAINDSIYVNDSVCGVVQANATYQWVDCGTNQPINGANSQTFTASQNGTYQCIVTKDGCSDTTACVTVTTVGINEIPTYYINLSPNPTFGTVEIRQNYPYPVHIKITDMLGRIVKEQDLQTQVTHIDISEFAAGIYQLSVWNNMQQLNVLRLVKQ